MKNKAQRICKKIFAALIIITLLSMLILPGVVFALEKRDGDAFLDGLAAALTFIVLSVSLLQEIAYYNALNYFLGDPETKTKLKTFLFGALFLGTSVLLLMEAMDILLYLL